jgi:predicted RNA binding protein YcfA (HicA-like mRNA interferase family)
MTHPGPPPHKVVIPLHPAVRVGTLEEIIKEVARHLGVPIEDVLNK